MGGQVSPDTLKLFDGFAGLAALVNGLLLWPVVRSLKREQSALRDMLKPLVSKKTSRKAPARKRR